MNSNIILIIFLLPIIAILNLVTQQSRFLIVLISLEILTLNLVVFTSLSYQLAILNITSIRVVLLTIGACEARFGLTLIVLISRSKGSDMLKPSNINKC